MFERSLEEKNLTPRIIEFASVNSLRSCLKLGLGITVCPLVAVAEELLAGSLVKLNWASRQNQTSVIMIWHTEKWCSPLLKEFMDLSKEAMAAPVAGVR